jgi:hypothetical protein
MIDISKITEYLYVGSRVKEEHSEELKVLKFNLMISMIAQYAPDQVYMAAPFKTLWIKTYDTFLTPISIKKMLVGVEAAWPIIRSGGKVLVFCMMGRHRSIIMASAILISQGYTADEATKLLSKMREIADPRTWYVRWQIHKFERYWLRNKVIILKSLEETLKENAKLTG